MNKLFSSAVIATCALGLKLRTKECNWRKSVGEIAHYIDYDLSGDLDMNELLSVIYYDVQDYEEAYEAEKILQGVMDEHGGKMTSQDLIHYFEKLIMEGEEDEDEFAEAACWLKDEFAHYATQWSDDSYGNYTYGNDTYWGDSYGNDTYWNATQWNDTYWGDSKPCNHTGGNQSHWENYDYDFGYG